MPLGVITNVMRDGDPADPGNPAPYVLATISGVGTDVRAGYYGNPPPLLTVNEFTDTGGGQWFCEGPKGYDIRLVLHEDFTIVPTTSADGTAACDTPWDVDVNGTGSSLQAYTGLGLGVARLVAGATANRFTRIRKDNGAMLGSAADAFWMSTRVLVNELTNTDILVGLTDTAATTYAFARFNTSVDTNWTLITSDGTLSGSSTTATTVTQAWTNLDLLLVPGVFCALWVDGDGPYPLAADATTGVPDASDSLTPWVRCLALGAAQRNLFIDYVDVVALNGTVAHPTEHPIIVNT